MMYTDPDLPAPEQIARQAKIIDALVRRASQQNDLGLTAYSAFQSAIKLQAQVAAKTRDLELAATELENVRFDQMRTRRSLDDALAVMEGGFALFADGQLAVCNDLFRELLPDVTHRVRTGLGLAEYFDLLVRSAALKSGQAELARATQSWLTDRDADRVLSHVIGLGGDRWYQLNVQRTSSDNMVLLLTDITAIVRRNRSEKETLIDRQAAYLQAVFENMTSGVCTFSRQGEVMMFNGSFRDLLGLSYRSLMRGMSLDHLLDVMRRQSKIADTTLADLVDWCRGAQADGAFRTRARQGAFRVLDVQANVLPDGGFLIELKDVTLEARATETLENRVLERTAELTHANAQLTEQYEDQARVEEELRLAKERAEAAVSSKTRFLAAASHDLLQPINAAKLMLATLQETTRQTPYAPNVARLQRAFTSIEQLLHALLDISRLDSADSDLVQHSDVCLGLLMQGIFEDQSAVADQKGVTLRVVPSMAWVRSDPVYLLRSLQNLVVNAIQYNRPGGKVLVGCRTVGNKLRLEVWDSGIGISKDDQSRIFEEFTRADTTHIGNGVGLGLSVVERACRHLGHRLWVRSEPGVGSMFCIELDRVPPPRDGQVETQIPTLTQDQPLQLIAMVIENDEDVLFATCQMLEQWGADVIAVTSTEEALRHVRDMGMPPDIILADYQLDEGDTGTRAIHEIRNLTGVRVPAILITATDPDDFKGPGQEAEFSVLRKPVQVSRLRPLIAWKVRWQSPQIDVAAQTKVCDDGIGTRGDAAVERSNL